jgi:hypothetical protein
MLRGLPKKDLKSAALSCRALAEVACHPSVAAAHASAYDCCIHGRPDVLRILLDERRPTGCELASYLRMACALEPARPDVVRLLLKAGAPVGVADSSQMTPLHMAAQGGNTEAVRLLLEAGAPVDALDYRGRTPMDYVHGRHAWSRACLVELLRHGADPSKHLQSYRCRSAMKSARVSLW